VGHTGAGGSRGGRRDRDDVPAIGDPHRRERPGRVDQPQLAEPQRHVPGQGPTPEL